MPSFPRLIQGGFTLCAAIGLGACTMLETRLAAPAALANDSEVHAAEDRSLFSGAFANESFRIGPYAVSDVDRDWDKSSSVGLGDYSRAKITSGYEFRFAAPSGTGKARCSSRRDKDAVALSGSSSLAWVHDQRTCRCELNGAIAEITLSDDGDSAQLSGQHYSVQRLHHTEQGMRLPEPLGFSLSTLEGQAVGAVELEHPGRIWLGSALSPADKAQLSCVFSGLLLFQAPDLD